MKLNPADAFKLYHIAKIHFTSDAGYIHKYGWNMKKIPNFNTRKDKHFFIRLARKYRKPEHFQEFLVANMSHNPDYWAGDLIQDECNDRYLQWVGRQESIEATFKNEVFTAIENLWANGKKFSELYNPLNGSRPQLLRFYNKGILSLDTMVLLDNILQYTKTFNRDLGDDDPEWRTLRRKLELYRPLLQTPKGFTSKSILIMRDIISDFDWKR